MQAYGSLLRKLAILGALVLAAPLTAATAAEPVICISDCEDEICCAYCEGLESGCWGAACSDGETTVSEGGCYEE